VLEYGDLRFTFNEQDFAERCEQAAVRLGFVHDPLTDSEREDLLNLTINGEITNPLSPLGKHANECWPHLQKSAQDSLVHWLRRLIFRGAWLDQRVLEGDLDVVFCEETCSFEYVQPSQANKPVALSPEPSWEQVSYLPR
jgi:hypothetical protein